MNDTLSQAQQLLLAAASIEQPFHESRLIKAAWIKDKLAFGMKTMEEEFPSDNKVRALLTGRRGLIDRGLFRKVGKLTYALTDAGEREAKELANGGTRKD